MNSVDMPGEMNEWIQLSIDVNTSRRMKQWKFAVEYVRFGWLPEERIDSGISEDVRVGTYMYEEEFKERA